MSRKYAQALEDIYNNCTSLMQAKEIAGEALGIEDFCEEDLEELDLEMDSENPFEFGNLWED